MGTGVSEDCYQVAEVKRLPYDYCLSISYIEIGSGLASLKLREGKGGNPAFLIGNANHTTQSDHTCRFSATHLPLQALLYQNRI